MVLRLALGVLLGASAASAQPSLWRLAPVGETTLSLTAARPSARYVDLGGAGSVWAVEAVVPVRPGLRLTVEVPFGFASPELILVDSLSNEVGVASGVQAALGNVDLGARVDARPGLTVGGGVRLPTTLRTSGRGSTFVGTASDLVEPGRAASIDAIGQTASLYGVVTYDLPVRAGLSAHLAAVPTLTSFRLGRGDDPFLTRQLATYVSLAALGRAAVGPARVGAGVGGTIWTSGSRAGLEPDLSVGALADVAVGRARPSLGFTIPLSGNDFVRAVVVAGVSVSLD